MAHWQMLTDAEIIITGNKAELLKDGEKIVATILQPNDAVFQVISAENKAPEMKNYGYRLLLVTWIETDSYTEIVINIS